MGRSGDLAGVRRKAERRAYLRKLEAVERACRGMAAGATLAEICRDPRMPPRSTFDYWLQRHPELRAQVEAARAQWPERRRDCHRYSERLAEEVLARVAAGRGLAEVCAEPDMPGAASVHRWINERPDFARRYALAKEAQAERLFDLAWAIALEAGDEEEVRSARLKIATLKWRVARLAPRRFGAFKAAEAPAEALGAVGAEGAEGAGGAGDADDGRLRVELRRFARRPDGTVAEITHLVRGLTPERGAALRAEVESGRLAAPSPRPRGGGEGAGWG
jgi:hypothetical protein